MDSARPSTPSGSHTPPQGLRVPPAIQVAPVDVSAGLRTSALAAEMAGFTIAVHLAVESCGFANSRAARRKGKEFLAWEIVDLNEETTVAFVQVAAQRGGLYLYPHSWVSM